MWVNSKGYLILWGRLERKGLIAAEECLEITEIRGIRTMAHGNGSWWFKSEADPSSCDRLKDGLNKLLARKAEINPDLPDLHRTESSCHFALSWVSVVLWPLQHPLQFNCDLSCSVRESSAVGLIHHTHFGACPIPPSSAWRWANPQPVIYSTGYQLLLLLCVKKALVKLPKLQSDLSQLFDMKVRLRMRVHLRARVWVPAAARGQVPQHPQRSARLSAWVTSKEEPHGATWHWAGLKHSRVQPTLVCKEMAWPHGALS